VLGVTAASAAAQVSTSKDAQQIHLNLARALSLQIKPYWHAPEGRDEEKLVTVLTWELRPDGSLAGPPQVAYQEGITRANRALAPKHAANAIEAVTRAAPFKLPSQYYGMWRREMVRFDRRTK
jgi:hypothetical protein